MPNARNIIVPNIRRNNRRSKNKENDNEKLKVEQSANKDFSKGNNDQLTKRRHLSSREVNRPNSTENHSFNDFVKDFQSAKSLEKYNDVFTDISSTQENSVKPENCVIVEKSSNYAPPVSAIVTSGLPSEAACTPPFPRNEALVLRTSPATPELPSPILDFRRILPSDVFDIDLCSESDIFPETYTYLKIQEEKFIVPADYLENNTIDSNMRSILVDWLLQVQHYLRLGQETLHLAVRILDTVLDRRDVDGNKLQLVGITALLIASKLEEYYPADIKKLLHLTEYSYEKKQLLQMEIILLEVLNFQVYSPTPQDFLSRYCSAALREEDGTFVKTCQLLIDVHLISESHSCLAPSLVTSAAVFTSLLLFSLSATDCLNCEELNQLWTPTLEFYSTYKVSSLYSLANMMLELYMLQDLRGVFNKYRSVSQHNKLTSAAHLEEGVIERGLRLLKNSPS